MQENITLIIVQGIPLLGALAAALLGLLNPARIRLPERVLGWLLAVFPLTAFSLLFSMLPQLRGGQGLFFSLPWMPALGLEASWYLDALGALFALLVTGIGTLVVIYSGYYFSGEEHSWRFHAYLMLFMFFMLGVVIAGDVILLFLFWEGTSLTSFLLIGYKYKEEAARKGAFNALLVTGAGGVALLAGLLMVSTLGGSTSLPELIGKAGSLQGEALYPLMLVLLALAAVTKSAQVPFHFWLPQAMSAPTPASAYLHSATMVKAGLYLMARFNPMLGGTDLWFWILSLFGLVTMLTGAYQGLKQNDLKALLAYSTISQLGVLMMLIGQDTSLAFKALVVGVLAHALYKSALFLIAGIVDHEAGTRDMRQLGGLAGKMPLTAAVAFLAALSMAGLPPLFGFLAKETLLATVTHPSFPLAASVIFTVAVVLSGALMLAQAGMLVWDTFFGRRKESGGYAHEAPKGMILAPALPALVSLMIAAFIEPAPVAAFLADAAGSAYGGTVKVSLALWTGINPPLVLSAVAISLGGLIFLQRVRLRAWQERMAERLDHFSFSALYERSLEGIDWLAGQVVATQNGSLRRYLVVMLAGSGLLMVLFGQVPHLASGLTLPVLGFPNPMSILQLVTLLMVAGAALASVVLRRDLHAVLALGASGLGVGFLMALEPAPDIALVQVIVDILTTTILVLALIRIPWQLRQQAQNLDQHERRGQLWRDVLISAGGGLTVAVMAYSALITRPRISLVTPFYQQNAKGLTGSADIVGAILVDFRGFDTLIEITVFAVAGLGVYTLLRHAAGRFPLGDCAPLHHAELDSASRLRDISGRSPSLFVRLLTETSLPLSMVIAVVHILYGHNQPGDGFTAGVVVSLTFGLWYIVYGYEYTRRRLPWLRLIPLVGSGVLLALLTEASALLLTGTFFSPVDYGELLGLQLPAGVHLSTSLLFEISIFLAVLGGASLILDSLAHLPEGTAPLPDPDLVSGSEEDDQNPNIKIPAAHQKGQA